MKGEYDAARVDMNDSSVEMAIVHVVMTKMHATLSEKALHAAKLAWI